MKSRNPIQTHAAKLVWYSSLMVCVAVMIGQALAMRVDKHLLTDYPLLMQVLIVRESHIIIAFLVAIFLYFEKPTRRMSTALSLGVLGGAYLTFAVSQIAYMNCSRPWAALITPKVLTIFVSVLDFGSIWINAGLILLAAIETVSLWFALDLGAAPGTFGTEPIYTVFFFVLSLVGLTLQVRNQRLARELSDALAEAQANKHIAGVFLTVRDRANTPLQSVKLGLSLLRRKYPAAELTDPMERSVEQMEHLFEEFQKFENHAEWTRR